MAAGWWSRIVPGLRPDNASATAAVATRAMPEAERPPARTATAEEAFVHEAMARRARGDLAGTVALLRAELPRRPSALGHYLLGETLLTLGDYVAGWPLFEFRWLHPDLVAKRVHYGRPAWTGQSLRGRTVLVQVEQGIGDVVMFARYLPWLKALGARVLLLPRVDMAAIARRLPGVDEVLDDGAAVPAFDYVVHLMSLPGRFGTTVDSVPADVPYVVAEPSRAAAWEARLAGDATPRVGLVWAGRATQSHNHLRSIPLRALAPLVATPGVRFYSLQKGPGEAELGDLPADAPITPLGAAFDDVEDLVAAMAQLDLVITVCTGPAHLAGAMGKPVWTMIAEPPDLRWLTRRDDSPWYPTMRLFRQRTPGRWDDVVERVRAELSRGPDAWRALAAKRAPPVPVPRPIVRDARMRDGLARLAETRQGLLMFDPDEPLVGDSLAHYGEWLHATLELALRLAKPGDVIAEAGAGVGAHAVAIGRRIGSEGRAVLHEPRAAARCMLAQNLAVNGIGSATLIDAAALRIDDLGLSRLDGLKANAPADAGAILAGAADALWRFRPWLMLETEDASIAALAASVREFGYRTWRLETPLFSPANFNRQEDDLFGGRTGIALVALPEERDWRDALPGCVELA